MRNLLMLPLADAAIKGPGPMARGRSVPAATTGAMVWADGWVLAAIGAACALRLVRLDAAPLWLDEVLSADWIALPWAETVRAAVTDNHPPLYFLLLKAWVLIAGDADWALRLPSALASSSAVGLIAVLASLLAGVAAARWAAWFAALSPYLVHHGQEARMYGLVTALAALQLVILVRFLRGDAARLGAAFVGSGWALAATHYYAALFIVGEILALLALVWWTPRRHAALPAAVLTALAPIAAVAAVCLLARHQAGRQYGLGLLALPGALWSMLAGYTLLPSAETLHADGWRAALPYLPVGACGGVAVLIAGVYGVRALSAAARVLVVFGLGTAIAVPFAAQSIAAVGINPRYLAAGMPLFLALLAAGAPRRLAWNVRSAAAVGIVAVMALGTARHLAEPGHGREDVDAAGRWLDAHVPHDREILLTSFEMNIVARHRWPSRRLRLYPDTGVAADAGNAAALAAALPFGGADRAYYVLGRAWVSDPDGALRRAVLERYRPCEGAAVRGVEILCLRAPTS